MSEFYKEVGTLFGLDEQQAEHLNLGLIQLAQEFNSASEVSDQAFSAQFYQKFEQLALTSGIQEDEIEALVNVLYFNDVHQQVVTYIVPSYYNSGGDHEQFSDTYQLMMDDLQQELED